MDTLMFSIIVPACNVAPYAADLINSLKAQTEPDFEVLIVNEESNDGTFDELTKSIAEDPRFEIIRMPRSGTASVSRNYGIEHARGTYLVFVDGDDWIEPDSLARFRASIEKFDHPDVLLANWIFHLQKNGTTDLAKKERCHNLIPDTIYTGADALRLNLAGEIHTGSPLYICRRAFLLEAHLRQIPGRRYEDDEWLPRLMLNAQRVLYMDYAFYHYRKRENSVTTDANPQYIVDFTTNFLEQLDFLQTHKLPEELHNQWANWLGRIFFVYFASSSCHRYPRQFRQQELNRLIKTAMVFRQVINLLSHARISKKILIPLLYLARMPGGFLVAEFLYRRLYWPLTVTVWGKLKAMRGK